jgi:TRAP-type mannitol/chloroaromatic compound transport system permease small subunit
MNQRTDEFGAQASISLDDPNLNLDNITSHTTLPHTRLSLWFDKTLGIIGEFASYLWVILMIVIVGNVLLRYVAGEGRIEFEELQWHLYAMGWLFGLSYCFVHDDHVRVDLIHDRLSLKARAWIELFGITLLLAPFLVLVIWFSGPFISYSFELNEISNAPGGLPYRWAIKAMLMVGFVLLAFAVLSRLSRVVCLLFCPSLTTPITRTEAHHGNQ